VINILSIPIVKHTVASIAINNANTKNHDAAINPLIIAPVYSKINQCFLHTAKLETLNTKPPANRAAGIAVVMIVVLQKNLKAGYFPIISFPVETTFLTTDSSPSL
jgi:hypothetical protein